MRSLETTAPTALSDCCSAMGPSAFSSATRTSPSLPEVGRSLPAHRAGCRRRRGGRRGRCGCRWGRGRRRDAGDAEADAAGDAGRAGAAAGAGRRGRRGAGEADAPRRRGRRRACGCGRGDATGAITGAGAERAASLVRISMKPSPVFVTEESKPWPATTFWTCSRRDGLVREPDGPDGAAREVDGELQADLAPGDGSEEQEDQARDGDEQREREEPVPLADDVKHVRAPLPGRRGRRSDGPGTPLR